MDDRGRTIRPASFGTGGSLSFEIVPMEETDLETVLRIEEAAHSHPWRLSMFSNEFRNPCSHRYVVRAGGNGDLIGYVFFWIVMDEVYLMNLSIHPEWWRRGVGERLARWVLGFTSEKGVKKASLEVRTSNLPARRLYEKIGFKNAAIRPGYYREPREDGLIMTLEQG